MKLLLLLIGGLKWGKLLAGAGTMVLSLALYAAVWGWAFAAGFVALLLVHEMGHYLAARERGLPVGLPMFIPFLGAVITMQRAPRDVETEAYIAFAGPFLGTIGAFAVYGWALHTGSTLGLALAYSGFILNLFNLLPVAPLDGGRICAVLGPRIWLLGAPLLIGLLMWRPNPALFVVALLAVPRLMRALRHDPRTPASRAYYGVSATTRLEYMVLYFGLVALLALVALHTHRDLAALVHRG